MSLLGNPTINAGVARRLIEHPFQCWFYGDSIGFEGLIAGADSLQDKSLFEFCHGFFRAWATRMKPFQPDDNTAPGHVICEVVERTGDQLLRAAALSLADHLRSRRKHNNVSITFEDTLRSLTEPYGDLSLSSEQEVLMRNPGAGVYLDCMHFDPPFFAHLSRLDPDRGWAEEAVKEILGYKALLFDSDLGLYRHFWLEKTGCAYTNGWGRGQGWALLGLIDVAQYAPGNTKNIDAVRNEALALARRMVDYQLDDGNWHSLAHEPRSGPESSTAAFMATAFFRGMAAELLPVDEFSEPAERAFSAMEKNLDDEGNLLGVSAAVYSALVEEHYWHVPLNKIVPWGQGPVLTATAARRKFVESA